MTFETASIPMVTFLALGMLLLVLVGYLMALSARLDRERQPVRVKVTVDPQAPHLRDRRPPGSPWQDC